MWAWDVVAVDNIVMKSGVYDDFSLLKCLQSFA